jgi:lipopolysaccharide biosynthesis glycosyltransferase
MRASTESPPTATHQRGLEVVFALHDADGKYWLNTAVAIASVVRHASRPIRINIIHDKTLSDVAIRRLSHLVGQTRHELRFIDITLPNSIRRFNFRQFSVASIYRLAIPQIFADQDAVLYLDSDLVACGLDVVNVMAGQLPDSPVSGVIDSFIGLHERTRVRLEHLRLDPQRYINSGVLLFRPKLLDKDLIDQFLRFESSHGPSIHPDQDFINYRFHDQIAYLETQYNFQLSPALGRMFLPLDQYLGKILHYAGKIKPLDMRIAPGLLPFWQYSADVPEIFIYYSQAVFSYLYPVDGDSRRVIAKPVTNGSR